ncbi:MAG: GNAT family N-acetyltransferase [Spirochaetaceae bacterium]|jgi:ribosomal protein S18 acetylase RimI-like enzyme|nr:GNAT family N-acetyltransferase [Spirochaetaceae bacterium]
MNVFPLYRWWKAHEIERIWPETMLKAREPYCVSACSRFKEMNFAEDHAWVLSSEGQSVTAILLHSKGALYPVFGNKTELYIPPFMYRFFKNIDINILQGLERDTDTLEGLLAEAGIFAEERRDYNLMAQEAGADIETPYIPKWLTIRPARFSDLDELTILQEGYHREEVLRNPADYNPIICRLGLIKVIEEAKTAVAIADGVIVGKINTSAFAFNRYQLGGVYVLPEYRGRGIARAMTAVLTNALLSEGMGVSLYVKKTNFAAEHVYRRCGFSKLADYRIVYMQ